MSRLFSFAFLLFLFITVRSQPEVLTPAAPKDEPLKKVPAAKKLMVSSHVDEKGGFQFMLFEVGNGIFIEVNGAIVTTNMTEILEVSGHYTFGKLDLDFVGNEKDGFITIKSEIQIGTLAIKTILGK